MTETRTPQLAVATLLAALIACKSGGNESPTAEKPAEPPKAASAPAPSPKPAEPPAAAPKPAEAKPAEPPKTLPADGIPEIPAGRSNPPSGAEWEAAPEVNTQAANSRPEGCYMKVVREWLKVNCAGKQYVSWDTKMELPKLKDIDFLSRLGTEGSDWFKHAKAGEVFDFIIRLKKGADLRLHVNRDKGGYASLWVYWPGGKDKPTQIALGKGGNWK